MQKDEEEYIAYRPDKYILAGDNSKLEDEDEFPYEKTLPDFKWNQYMNEYNSLAAQDISFKRVKRDEDPPAEDQPLPMPPPPLEIPGGGDAGGGEGGDGGKTDDGGEIKLFLSPIIGLTAFFAFVFIIGPFFVRNGPNRGIIQCSIMLSAFCMWIFWVTVYIGQMNPLMGPRLENTTVAWLAVKVGNAIKSQNASSGGGTE